MEAVGDSAFVDSHSDDRKAKTEAGRGAGVENSKLLFQAS